MARAISDRSSKPLIEELEALRSAIHSISEGVIIADKDGRFLLCNRMAQSILAPSLLKQPPKSWAGVDGCYMPDGVTPIPQDRLPAARALAGEVVTETDIYICNERHPSGIWLSVQARPLLNKAGEISGSVVTFHDVTRKKEADAQIRILTNAVEQTADGIIITDRGGIIEYVNPAFELTTGYSRKELQGLTPRILKSGV
ncbi:MAG: PAS domain S-box protein, partial [Acidobacteria bacterium]|nr:PAS domain S-box protein [Acidobacteriota bacterium]